MSDLEQMMRRYSEESGVPLEVLEKQLAEDLDRFYGAALHGITVSS